jgi:mono/diheme cytochrome c family protein
MKQKTKTKFSWIMILALALSTMSFKAERKIQMAKFVAPASADALKNPLAGNATSIADGKKLYDANCAICHGAKGKGDGVAAAGLTKAPADHSSVAVQKQTDGAIFWKIAEGNNPMPAYKAVYSETQRWQLVNYIRTLAKPSKK